MKNLPEGTLSVAGYAVDAGDFYLRLEDAESAEKALMLALRYMDLFYAKKDHYVNVFAHDRHRCATILGLLALQKGDRAAAIEWFKESCVAVRFVFVYERGYDLRLLKKMMQDPTLRELCIAFLERILNDNTPQNDEIKALLAQLKGDGPRAIAIGATESGEVAAVEPEDPTSRKPVAEPTQPNHTRPQNAKKTSINPGAIVAVIVAVVLAVVIANRGKKAKREKR